jgi:hypothetical protein
MLPPCQCPKDHLCELRGFMRKIAKCEDNKGPFFFKVCPRTSMGGKGLRTGCALWIPSNNRPGYSVTFSREAHTESSENPIPDFACAVWMSVSSRNGAWDAVKGYIQAAVPSPVFELLEQETTGNSAQSHVH